MGSEGPADVQWNDIRNTKMVTSGPANFFFLLAPSKVLKNLVTFYIKKKTKLCFILLAFFCYGNLISFLHVLLKVYYYCFFTLALSKKFLTFRPWSGRINREHRMDLLAPYNFNGWSRHLQCTTFAVKFLPYNNINAYPNACCLVFTIYM